MDRKFAFKVKSLILLKVNLPGWKLRLGVSRKNKRDTTVAHLILVPISNSIWHFKISFSGHPIQLIMITVP